MARPLVGDPVRPVDVVEPAEVPEDQADGDHPQFRGEHPITRLLVRNRCFTRATPGSPCGRGPGPGGRATGGESRPGGQRAHTGRP